MHCLQTPTHQAPRNILAADLGFNINVPHNFGFTALRTLPMPKTCRYMPASCVAM
jgi:hypothetical protein